MSQAALQRRVQKFPYRFFNRDEKMGRDSQRSMTMEIFYT